MDARFIFSCQLGIFASNGRIYSSTTIVGGKKIENAWCTTRFFFHARFSNFGWLSKRGANV